MTGRPFRLSCNDEAGLMRDDGHDDGKRGRLAAHRRAMSFTQEAFAERLGVDVSTVRRWESGRSEPQPWQREKIARALQVSPGRLDELLADGLTARSTETGRLLMPSGGDGI